jgi:hypothetical protein
MDQIPGSASESRAQVRTKGGSWLVSAFKTATAEEVANSTGANSTNAHCRALA